MPLSAANTVSARLNALHRDYSKLNAALSRVLQANGPYYDMRPWRISYFRHLLIQAGNLQINALGLNVVLLQMLGHTTGPTKQHLTAQHEQLDLMLQNVIQLRSRLSTKIAQNQASLQRGQKPR